MKFSSLALLCLIASTAKASSHSGDHEDECTHGKLFVVDDSSSDVHVIDVSEGNLQDLTVETTVTLPARGAGQLVYYGAPADPVLVQYRDQVENGYKDSFVRAIDTGFSYDGHGDHGHVEYTAPSVLQNAIIDGSDCVRPIHQVRHDDKIAIFCDGSFEHEPQLNTSIVVIDKTKLSSSSESAIIHSTTLQGTHHGVAIPIDDGHLLHSLALQGRIDRLPDVTSLPATFQVVDLEGNILHELTDTTNPDTHCSGFHGSASVDNTFVLGCDDVHGGIVVVQYDPTSETYTSRALKYPDGEEFAGFRIGSFAYHKNSDHLVGAYSVREGTEYHLAAISPSMMALDDSNLITLPDGQRQCAYQFEVGTGEHLLVFMPNGVLHVFEISPNGSFTEVMNQQVIPGMTACSEAAFVAGIGQAFIATPADRTLYAIDLAHVEEGEMEVYPSTLPFTPTGMTVGGFSLEAACAGRHDHVEDMTSAAISVFSLSSLSVATVAMAFLVIAVSSDSWLV